MVAWRKYVFIIMIIMMVAVIVALWLGSLGLSGEHALLQAMFENREVELLDHIKQQLHFYSADLQASLIPAFAVVFAVQAYIVHTLHIILKRSQQTEIPKND